MKFDYECSWCDREFPQTTLKKMQEHEGKCPRNPYKARIAELDGMLKTTLKALSRISDEIGRGL